MARFNFINYLFAIFVVLAMVAHARPASSDPDIDTVAGMPGMSKRPGTSMGGEDKDSGSTPEADTEEEYMADMKEAIKAAASVCILKKSVEEGLLTNADTGCLKGYSYHCWPSSYSWSRYHSAYNHCCCSQQALGQREAIRIGCGFSGCVQARKAQHAVKHSPYWSYARRARLGTSMLNVWLAFFLGVEVRRRVSVCF